MRRLFAFLPLLLLTALLACGSQDAPKAAIRETTPDPTLIVALDDEYRGGALITVIDWTAGRQIAQMESGYQTWTLLRRGARELIVSDFERLEVFGLDDPYLRKWSKNLPNREVPIGYFPAWALSEDSHYLYYVKRTNRCPEGGLNTVCDVHWLVVIDLDARGQVAETQLPDACGFAYPYTFRQSDALVLCNNTNLVIAVTPDGRQSTVAKLRRPASVSSNDGIVYAGISPDGMPFAAFRDGTVVIGADGEISSSLLPSDELALDLWVASPLDGDRVLLGYGHPDRQTIYGPMILQGLIAFDARNPTEPQRVSLPDPTFHAASLYGDRVAILTGNPRTVSILRLSTGETLVENVPVPPATKWLIGR